MILSRGLLWIAMGVTAAHPWPTNPGSKTLGTRLAPPAGFERVPTATGSFGAWLRSLPTLPDRPQVRLHNGALKGNQTAHALVLDIDVGARDLQQCADATMRLRAEYLWAQDQADRVCFRFTSGDAMAWTRWRAGHRPVVSGSKVGWKKKSPDSSYASFRRYLDVVFTYAGTSSLQEELIAIKDPRSIEMGDVFIQGGFPGHAVIVLDVAANSKGERVFLLAQSYMPAQQIHVLRNPASPSPWYTAESEGVLITPEWRFSYRDLRRFARDPCPPKR